MSSKQIDITCPCCSSRLTVDVLTEKVLKSQSATAPADGGDKWSSASRKVLERTSSGAEKLENALQQERDKKARLDDRFRQAQEKLKRGDDDA